MFRVWIYILEISLVQLLYHYSYLSIFHVSEKWIKLTQNVLKVQTQLYWKEKQACFIKWRTRPQLCNNILNLINQVFKKCSYCIVSRIWPLLSYFFNRLRGDTCVGWCNFERFVFKKHSLWLLSIIIWLCCL